MGHLREKMEADLKIGGYSQGTQEIYLYYAQKYAKYFGRSPAEMGSDEVRLFLLYFVSHEYSRSTLKQIRAALMFLYRVTLKRPIEVEWIPSIRKLQRINPSGLEWQRDISATQSSERGEVSNVADDNVRRRSADFRGLPSASHGHRF
jgi:hypothetical protein